MIQFPQLRVRTGFSFKKAYGHLDDVAARLQAINAGAGGIVDAGTWGHVKYEEAMKKAGIVPMFGAELPVVTEGSEYKPKAWVLARDTRELYRMTSKAERNGGVSAVELVHSQGLIRFMGGAINSPHGAFDYVDINPASITHAYKSVQYARRFGKPMVITSYNDMPDFKHEADAYAWEVRQSVGPRIISDIDALREHLADVMKGSEFVSAVENAQAIAEQLKGVTLQKAPLISLEGDMVAEAREGMRERLALGHIKEWTEEYEARFNSEVEIIKAKAFDSYFLCVADLIKFAKTKMLVGPARGSSAGSLVCYLLRITEVDPIKYGLLFYRFIDISRADFPDIDIDFADTKRYMVFDYLKEKYGEHHVSKLGNVNFLKGLSTLEKVRQKFALPFSATDQVKSSLVADYPEGDPRYGYAVEDTITQTEAGRDFARRFESAALRASAIEIHPSHSGVHAAGIIVCNEPISDFVTVTADGIAQVDKRDAEKLNLLKIDALGLRTLGVIEDAHVVTADELYALEPTDPACFALLDSDKVGGLFQFEGDAVRSITRQMHIDRFDQIDHITSLARPGPMSSGMANTYIKRANGKEAVTYDIPQLKDILEPTHGVIVYQEQIMSIVKDIAGFDWEQTSSIRRAMGKKMGDEYFNKKLAEFVDGCAKTCGVSADAATKIWQQMRTFGSYGFNRSHSVSYGLVTYWTLYMKVYHRLEYAAASLRAAKDDEQVYAILRELAAEGVPYTPMDPDYSETNWMVANGRLVGGIQNAKGYGAITALKYIEKRRLGLLTEKDRAKLAKAEVKFSDIAEARTRWGFAYDDPASIGVTSGNPIVQIKDVTGNDDCLIIVKLRKKVLQDENEPARQKKRVEEGKAAKYRGASQFLDMLCVDDSVDSPVKVRIRPDLFASHGKPIAENDPVGSWYLVRAKRFFSVFIVKNILRIDDKEWNK